MIEKESRGAKLSKEKWLSYVEAYERSEKTQSAFCEENKLSEESFKYFRKCYLKEKKRLNLIKQSSKSNLSKPSFVSVNLPESKLAGSDVIHARFSTGLVLSLPVSMSSGEIIKLLVTAR